MLRLMRSLGRLSVRGYLIGAGFVLVTVLATYAQINDQKQIAAQRARTQAVKQVESSEVSLNEADAATPVTPDPEVLSDNTTKSNGTPASQSSDVAKARHQNGVLVITPANFTISLSRSLPTVTISSTDYARLSAPRVTSTTGNVQLVPTSDDVTRRNWQMKLTGNPAPGTYRVQLAATADTVDGPVEYTGTLTVVVVL